MDNTIKIIGLDPGNRLGISVLYIDPYTYNIIKIDSRTITLEKYAIEEDLNYRLLLLYNIISDLYYQYKPNCVSMELAFLNMRYPKAVIQLSQYLAIIEYTLNQLDPTLKILKYAPMYIKAVASGSGKADKMGMLEAVQSNKELLPFLTLDNMSEHEIDATCIAYTAYQEIKKYNMYLLAM